MPKIYELKDKENTFRYSVAGALEKSIGNGIYNCIFYGVEEFILYLQRNGAIQCLSSSRMARAYRLTEDALSIEYAGKGVAAEVVYRFCDGILRKTIRITAGFSCRLVKIIVENMRTELPLSRGGEGQPIFVGGGVWCGLEFPAALNGIDQGTLAIEQNPYVLLGGGQVFESYALAFGFANAAGLEAGFRHYIGSRVKNRRDSLKIYGDWGLHDELSDKLELDEKMTLENVDRLTEIRDSHGVVFDYYLMDAYWFATGKPYTEYKKKTFPNGIKKALKKIEDAGMKYGLWFDINCIHAGLIGMEQYARLPENKSLCFACPEIARLMEEAISYHIKENNVRMLKFDFAYFDCENSAHEAHSPLLKESKEAGVTRFLAMLERIYQLEPDLRILAYNGFTTDLDYLGTAVRQPGHAVSPWWALFVDYIYCGDPRPSEFSGGSLADSIVYYSDCMVEKFDDALFPLSSIDDHGTMLGNTGTIYWYGKDCLRQSYIMNVMRGGGKLLLYGDINLLDSDDLAYLKAVNDIYDEIGSGKMTFYRLPGSPLMREVYGYAHSNGATGYIALINPGVSAAHYTVALPAWRTGNIVKARMVYSSTGGGKREETFSFNGLYRAGLAREEVMVFRWELDAGAAEAGRTRATVPAGTELTIEISPDAEAVAFYFFNGDSVLRTAYGFPDGLQFYAGGKPCMPTRSQLIWSGVSWLLFESPGKAVVIKNTNGKPYNLMWEERKA